MIEVSRINLPTYFEVVEEEVDSRFKKVKIFVAHTGENLNNSIFEKDVLEKMSSSLLYCPILGYVSVNEDDEKDFRTHEKRIKLVDGDVDISFATHAYGFIGEDHNARFEITGGKEWLVCDGYIWTRFKEVVQLFAEANGKKGQSMEIIDGSGYVDGEGRVVYTGGKFSGLCALGDDIPAAMTGANITTEFSKNSTKMLIEEMLTEFSATRGDTEMAEKAKKKKITDEEEVKATEEKPAKEKPDKEKPAVEKPAKEKPDKEKPTEEKPAKEEPAKENEVGADDKDDKENEPSEPTPTENEAAGGEDGGGSSDEGSEEFSTYRVEFELSHEDKRVALYAALNKAHENEENGDWRYIVQVFDNRFIVEVENYRENQRRFDQISYTVEDDVVIFGETIEVFPMFVTKGEKDQIDSQRQEIKDLTEQLNGLETFKEEIEMSKKEGILAANEARLSSKQVDDLKANFAQMTPDEVEKEIAFAIYKTEKEAHVDESPETSAVFATNIQDNKNKGKYGEYTEFFRRK